MIKCFGHYLDLLNHSWILLLEVNCYMKLFNLIFSLCRKIPGGGLLLRTIYSFECDKKAVIGKNVKFHHRGFGTVISARATIGDNVQIQHHVTLGTRHEGDRIIIGDNVYIGAYAMILGNVKIGHDAVIGASSIVLNDLEPCGTYVTTTELKRIK